MAGGDACRLFGLLSVAALSRAAAFFVTHDQVPAATSDPSPMLQVVLVDSVKIFANATEVPFHQAAGISFSDHDPHRGLLAGTIAVQRASNESDIDTYNIHWAENGVPGELLVSLPKTFDSLTYDLHDPYDLARGVVWMPFANQFMVVTANSAGAMKEGPRADIWDEWDPPLSKLLHGFLRGR